MTARSRKRGGSHFALTCDQDECEHAFNEPPTRFMVSVYTLRVEAGEQGWSTKADAGPFGDRVDDHCPDHSRVD